MDKRFVASLSRSQGRTAWAVIFRHPIRVDPNTGKPGLRVRQGLGTSDEAEASELKEQLNQLLADEAFWSLPHPPVPSTGERCCSEPLALARRPCYAN